MATSGAKLNGRVNEGTLRLALRVRAEACEAARAELLAAVEVADRLAKAEQSAIGAINREALAAADLQAGDHDVEAYAAWLPSGRLAVDAARAAREDAEVAVRAARTRLQAAHTAKSATERLLGEWEAAQGRRALELEQARADETAAVRHRRPPERG